MFLLVLLFWGLAFPCHLISGFVKCGLCPLERDAIPSHKLSKAEPHKIVPTELQPTPPAESQPTETVSTQPAESQPTETRQIQLSEPQSRSAIVNHHGGDKTEIVVNISGECTVAKTVTPVRHYLKG